MTPKSVISFGICERYKSYFYKSCKCTLQMFMFIHMNNKDYVTDIKFYQQTTYVVMHKETYSFNTFSEENSKSRYSLNRER